MKKSIKYLGLGLFYTGLIFFIISLTVSDYVLNDEIIRAQGSGEKYETLNIATGPMLNHVYTSNFSFLKDLDEAIAEANRQLIKKYMPDEKEIELIFSSASETGEVVFESSWIDLAIKTDTETDRFKNEMMHGFTSWMQGRRFPGKVALEEQLEKTLRDMRYAVENQKAFDNYSAKNLKFNLAKASSTGMLPEHIQLWFFLSFGLWLIGAGLYFYGTYHGISGGIKNNGVFYRALTNVGWLAIGIGTLLISFYVILYFFPEYLTNWVLLVDPISYWLNGGPASQWFLYGFLYTMAVLVMGTKMLLKYRHNKYQIIRTLSVMFFQTGIAFILPEILRSLNKPGFDFKNIWPLDYDFFYAYNLQELMDNGALGWFMLFWGLALIILAVPFFTYFFGKRWYCSWVCGCGGLAETLGDPFRHLSSKSLKSWKIERWMIYSVLVFAIINTAGVLYTYFTNSYTILGLSTETVKTSYGFLIGSIFSGVVGTGFYPLMGNRVWCRFGCPLAAYMGIIQRFKSRFRITTNGGQCISCGNCSTYCEMGIDVRWYAQRGQNIVRASCVGCGICSAVCPRGVLRLETGPEKARINVPELIGNNLLTTKNQI